jgi:hypothetical protein
MTAQPAAAPLPPCTRCASPIEHGDLRCAICALPVPAARDAAPSAAQAQVLRCTECGAAIAFSALAGAPRCAFCGATMQVEQPIDPVEAAELRVPFEVDRAEAEAALRGWLGQRGFFAPRTLKDEAVLESLSPLCWAGWIVSADAAIAWTADSDEGARRAAWAPHAGQVSLRFEQICVPATRGLDHEECQLLVPSYDLSKAVAIRAAELERGGVTMAAPEIPGEVPAVIESFDAQRSAARATIQRAIEATARTRIERHIPGRRFRNVRVACLLESQTTRRVALPAWVLAYRYRGAPYRAIVHGQRPEVVFGSSPKDWVKIAAVALAVLAALAAIALAVYLLRAP